MANNQPNNNERRRSWRNPVVRGWRSAMHRMSARSSRVAPLKNKEGLEGGASDPILTEFFTALKNELQWSEETIYDLLEKVAVKIFAEEWASSQCHRVTDIIVDFLMQMKRNSELEEQCATVLTAVGLRFPDLIIQEVLAIKHQLPRSLLFAVRNICARNATTPSIGHLWKHVLDAVQKHQIDKDTLFVCEVLNAVVSCVHDYLCLPTTEEENLQRRRKVSLNADDTFHLLCGVWSPNSEPEVTEELLSIFSKLFYYVPVFTLRNATQWLLQEMVKLVPSDVNPFHVAKCVNNLIHALRVRESGGFTRTSQAERAVVLLLKLLTVRVNKSDIKSVQSHTISQRAFISLTVLHGDAVARYLLQNLKSDDPDTIVLTLQVFTNILQYVPRTDELKGEVVRATIAVIQRDFPSVRDPAKKFVDTLDLLDYLISNQRDELILQLLRLTLTGESVERGAQVKELLQMVSVPQQLSVVCHPKNHGIFVPMSSIVLEQVLRARSLGGNPYLSGFHASPSQFISPQKLLLHLVMLSSKPYRADDLGASALTLLGALQPITSLHPVISAPFVQFCSKEIQKLLEVLRGHNQQTLNQEDWEHKLLEFSRKSLVAINDDEWLEPLLLVTMEKINNLDPFYLKDKAFLYRFFGFTLRTSRSTEMVNRMVLSLLRTSHQELDEREGIAEALSVVSRSHLELILNQLQVYGAALMDKDSSPILALTKEQQQREWGLVCETICSSLSKVLANRRRAISRYLDGILAFVLQSYRDSIIEKDISMKLDYLKALAKMINIICAQQLVAPSIEFPSIQDLEHLLMDILKEEPLDTLCSSIRLNAISLIVDLRKLKGISVWKEETAALVRTICKSVLCLPYKYKLYQQDPDPTEGKANVDLYRDTLKCVLRLLQTLVEETPSALEELLEVLDRWINSKKNYERDRAMWCISQLLKNVADNLSFNAEIEFTKLHRLVKLLALRCHDEVDNVCLLSSHAVYHLHRILLQQKQLTRKKMGLLVDERTGEIFSALSFYTDLPSVGRNSTSNIGKAFAEFFNETQLTHLVREAMGSLTGEATVSVISAQLMSAVLKERAGDLIQIEEVVRGLLCHLDSALEPRTKEELLHAMCWLAGQRTSTVIPLLLNQPLPWDRNKQIIWNEFGTERETALNVLQQLASFLEEREPEKDSREMDLQPVAVSCALLAILTDCVCRETVQELYPRLLLVMLCHVFWAAEKDSSQQVVVYRKVEGLDSKSKSFDPLSCALQAVRALILAADYSSVVLYADQENCWEILASPECFYLGVITLTRAMVSSCPTAVVHQILDLTLVMLESFDYHQKRLAQSIYAQLLCHRSVVDILGQEALYTVERLIKENDPIVQEIGLLGMSHLALHPKLSEPLCTMIPVLRDFFRSTPRLKIQSLNTCRNIVITTKGKSTDVFLSIYKELRLLVNDERKEVRISATSVMGDMLEKMKLCKPRSSFTKEIHTFLVPLLLNLQEKDINLIKACVDTLKKWSKVTGWGSLTSLFKYGNLSNHFQVIEGAIKHLVWKRHMEVLGMILSESIDFLKSPQPLLRNHALTLIGIVLKNLPELHKSDLKIIEMALEAASNDPMPSIQQLAITTLQKILHIPPRSSVRKRCTDIFCNCILPSQANDLRLFKNK